MELKRHRSVREIAGALALLASALMMAVGVSPASAAGTTRT